MNFRKESPKSVNLTKKKRCRHRNANANANANKLSTHDHILTVTEIPQINKKELVIPPTVDLIKHKRHRGRAKLIKSREAKYKRILTVKEKEIHKPNCALKADFTLKVPEYGQTSHQKHDFQKGMLPTVNKLSNTRYRRGRAGYDIKFKKNKNKIPVFSIIGEIKESKDYSIIYNILSNYKDLNFILKFIGRIRSANIYQKLKNIGKDKIIVFNNELKINELMYEVTNTDFFIILGDNRYNIAEMSNKFSGSFSEHFNKKTIN